MVFHFYNTYFNSFSISFIISGGILISSTFPGFSSITCFGFTIWAAILFPVNSLIASAALWTSFWKQFLKHLVLYPVIVCYILFEMTKVRIL